jgi:mRNA deadenylase 3'-5' endonuclease subunit Ccr4
VTWNILSESHAKKMTAYDPNVLDTDFRWSLLSSQLLAWMQKGFIVCLQEVTRDLGFCRLKTLADSLAYEVAYRSFGTESNGFMGNVILVPRQRFSVENVHHVRVGALCTLLTARAYRHLFTSVLLRDVESGDHFFVSSYHMPCQYKKPEIMDAHCEALNKILSVARFPWFLAGDFNLSVEDMVKNFQGCKMLAGTSPTTHSCIRDTVFKGRLDHIVFSNLVQIEEEIPVHSVESLMPNAEQPSDHECVTAFFSLKN